MGNESDSCGKGERIFNDAVKQPRALTAVRLLTLSPFSVDELISFFFVAL
jgi:hypothetical protein